MAVGGWILLSGPQGAPYTDATLLYAESDALRQLSQLTSNTISIKPMSVWRFSNFPTRRNFNCFRRKSSPESCGIQVAHFNCMLAVGRTGAPEKYQVRLTLARRADPANKSGTNARWEFWGKWSLKLLTQKLIMSKISGLWLRETLSLLPFSCFGFHNFLLGEQRKSAIPLSHRYRCFSFTHLSSWRWHLQGRESSASGQTWTQDPVASADPQRQSVWATKPLNHSGNWRESAHWQQDHRVTGL